ncbi:MAG TPA: hypothetical protein VK191_12830 [Symbiobacteriaceae bacterium]|nr:hypothetical protein [Symbiobacteriaceae bacterium]
MFQGRTNPAQIELALRQLQMVATLLEQSVQGWEAQLQGSAGASDLQAAADLARSLGQVLGRAARGLGDGALTRDSGATVTPLKRAHRYFPEGIG